MCRLAGVTATISAIMPHAANRCVERKQQPDAERDFAEAANVNERERRRQVWRHDAQVEIGIHEMYSRRRERRARRTPTSGFPSPCAVTRYCFASLRTNATTSSSTGATLRSGRENAPISVACPAFGYILSTTETPAAPSFCASCRVLRFRIYDGIALGGAEERARCGFETCTPSAGSLADSWDEKTPAALPRWSSGKNRTVRQGRSSRPTPTARRLRPSASAHRAPASRRYRRPNCGP